jgi:hypothetical protein
LVHDFYFQVVINPPLPPLPLPPMSDLDKEIKDKTERKRKRLYKKVIVIILVDV